jgi:hypothetical protein
MLWSGNLRVLLGDPLGGTFIVRTIVQPPKREDHPHSTRANPKNKCLPKGESISISSETAAQRRQAQERAQAA